MPCPSLLVRPPSLLILAAALALLAPACGDPDPGPGPVDDDDLLDDDDSSLDDDDVAPDDDDDVAPDDDDAAPDDDDVAPDDDDVAPDDDDTTPTCGDFCDPYSIVLLPDTQYYAEKLTDDADNTYYKQTQWIVDQQAARNIQFVVHLGDITDNNTDDEWQIASAAHATLDAAGVPYSVVAGNHDYLVGGDFQRSGSQLDDWFGPGRFAGQPWYGGNDGGGNENNWTTFEVGPMQFLILSLEYAPRKDALCWAEDVIAQHPDHRVIVATHCYQTHGGGYATGCPNPGYTTVGADGQTVWDELASRHANIFAVVAGHIGDSEHRISVGNVGNDVHELLVDYQFEGRCTASSAADCTEACRASTYTGNGWLRVLTFDPLTDQVHNETITVEDGNAAIFPGGVPVLFCSALYDTSSGNGGAWYDQDPAGLDHLFSFAYDLNTPISYAYDDLGQRGFHDRTVNSVAAGDQERPALGFDASGGFVAAWEDDSSSSDGSGNHDVLVRGFSACGCESFTDVVAHTNPAGQQQTPAVGVASNGDFVVAWADDADGNDVFQVHARGFHADGTQRFARITVNSEASGQQLAPAIAVAPDGRFVVAWEDDQDGDDEPQVWVRGFHADGSERFSDRSVHTDVAGERLAPAVGIDSGAAFVVAWQDDSDGNGTYQVHARGFTADGDERFARLTVNSVASGQQRAPAIGVDAAGGFVVAWEDDQDNDDDFQVLARRFQADGTPITEWTVPQGSGGQHLAPSVSMAAGGAFAIAWEDDSDDNGLYQVRGGTWTAAGSPWITEQTINAVADGQQLAPGAGIDELGTLVVLWEDDMDGNGTTQILGAGIDPP